MTVEALLLLRRPEAGSRGSWISAPRSPRWLPSSAHVALDEDGGRLTDTGRAFLEGIGVTLTSASKRRVFCRSCLDWSERRPHLAGVVGSALLAHAFDLGWVQRMKDSRALTVTAAGELGLEHRFGVALLS